MKCYLWYYLRLRVEFSSLKTNAWLELLTVSTRTPRREILKCKNRFNLKFLPVTAPKLLAHVAFCNLQYTSTGFGYNIYAFDMYVCIHLRRKARVVQKNSTRADEHPKNAD